MAAPALVIAAVLAAGCSSSSGGSSVDPAALAQARACARLSGCVGFEAEIGSLGGMSGCAYALGSLSLDGEAIADCALDAPDCDAAARCLDAGEAPAPCEPTADSSRCEGDVARVCLAGVTMAHDCAEEGLSCVEDGAGHAFCGRPGECDASECDGDTRIACINGAKMEQDCGDGVCLSAEELAGAAHCAGEGEPCDGPVFRCEGDVAVTCEFGRIHREPCGPGLCSTTDGAFCMSDPSCASPHCDGTEIVACADGEPRRFDCAQWGFDACAELEDGGVRCE